MKKGLVTLENDKKIKIVGDIYEKVHHANNEYLDYWIENTFLHWDFWLSLALTLLPWILFIQFRKKESTNRLLFVGLFVIIFASWLDFLGVVCGLWYYTGKVVPTIPSYMPWDFCILPVFVMFLIQYKPDMKAYWKGLFFASVGSFIGEPLFKWLGFYVAIHWNKFYSFPIYFLLFMVCHRLSKVKHFEPIK
ncbi:CBO0543 family protein [Bacillus yapensis]|uniref:CBO0543 family protein n=1 Tax=Bacillus yapensis TaxID=2492960 RepID=UPI001484D94C|nr:CBO0543 family protein [Bacillus yapensis]